MRPDSLHGSSPPLTSSIHHDSYPRRGQLTFTVLPSGAAHSQAKGKLKVFLSHRLTMAKVSETLAGLSTHPVFPGRKSQEATRQVDGHKKSGVLSVRSYGVCTAQTLELKVQQDTATSQLGAGDIPLTTS